MPCLRFTLATLPIVSNGVVSRALLVRRAFPCRDRLIHNHTERCNAPAGSHFFDKLPACALPEEELEHLCALDQT
jgi:hypothetical protein